MVRGPHIGGAFRIMQNMCNVTFNENTFNNLHQLFSQKV